MRPLYVPVRLAATVVAAAAATGCMSVGDDAPGGGARPSHSAGERGGGAPDGGPAATGGERRVRSRRPPTRTGARQGEEGQGRRRGQGRGREGGRRGKGRHPFGPAARPSDRGTAAGQGRGRRPAPTRTPPAEPSRTVEPQPTRAPGAARLTDAGADGGGAVLVGARAAGDAAGAAGAGSRGRGPGEGSACAMASARGDSPAELGMCYSVCLQGRGVRMVVDRLIPFARRHRRARRARVLSPVPWWTALRRSYCESRFTELTGACRLRDSGRFRILHVHHQY